MNYGQTATADPGLMEQSRKHINRLLEEIARLSESDLPPEQFYQQFLNHLHNSITAAASAVWLSPAPGQLALQHHINLPQAELDEADPRRTSHDQMLRQVAAQSKPMIVSPQISGAPNAANFYSDYTFLVAPILLEKQVTGLLEVWVSAQRNPDAQRGFLQFLVIAADLAASFMRNLRMRRMASEQQLWTQLEAFSRQVHSSLNPTEVSYLVANEGRRLIGCDRLSIAQRHGRRATVEAVSGADIVEKRSNLIQLMVALFDSVLKWDEKLVYSGTRDDSLPPDVLSSLNAYLAESNSKLLAVLPLRDEREKENGKPCRSALLLESFEPTATQQVMGRLEVIGKHATPALYNAFEHRRIPMRFIWVPLAALQEGLGGKARAIIAGIAAGIAVLTLLMVLVPYPLKMEAKGHLLPQERSMIYPPSEGHVKEIRVDTGDAVLSDQSLILMEDAALGQKLMELQRDIEAATRAIHTLNARFGVAQREDERKQILGERHNQEQIRDAKILQLNALRDRVNADETRGPGFFWIKAPREGTILNSGFKENLTGKFVRPSDPLLRIGEKNGPWEIELKIPQKHIGQVLEAFQSKQVKNNELDVDLLLSSEPTRTYKGKLARSKIAGEAVPNRDDPDDAEPVVLAVVRISGDDIDPAYKISREHLLADTKVHAKVRCGNHAMGYSLFYGVWEFLYEKVVFFF